jgi:hypothetical protein
MGLAAFELAAAGQDAELRTTADALAKVLGDDGAPRAARRDASEVLRAHVAFDAAVHDDAAMATWWHEHRDALRWDPTKHVFASTPVAN